ncbi:MAG: hypothetical protein QOI73_1774 [Solirubrobacteraceae bacterium]|nr:hypothetical protein [Solirubrobacteraceae bacterium]
MQPDDDLDLPRVRLLGKVRLTGSGTLPFNEREAAAARRLLVLLVLEANPLTLDYLDRRLHGDDSGPKRAELAAEIRRARSAISHALGDHAALLSTPRPGETALDERLEARVDLLELYDADASGRWEQVERLLKAADDAPLGGVSEFSFVYGDGGGRLLRLEQLCAEHRERVAAIRRRVEPEQALRERQRTRFRRPIAGALTALILAGIVIVAAQNGNANHAGTGTAPPPARLAKKLLVIDNSVTSGRAMREDRTPVSLTSRPDVYCGSGACLIARTTRSSGQTYDGAVCQTTGKRTTNGNDHDSADDSNPLRFESTRYYGVRLADGTFGFVSEVWVRTADRGGLGLSAC